MRRRRTKRRKSRRLSRFHDLGEPGVLKRGTCKILKNGAAVCKYASGKTRFVTMAAARHIMGR